MAKKRMAVEFGMGTDLRGEDYTKAACRALRDALWHNSLTLCQAFGRELDEMQVHIKIGVANPEAVDVQAVADVLPYGSATVEVSKGGLDVMQSNGTGKTVVANAAAVVYLDFD